MSISTYIKRDLQARLRTGQQLPVPLTLDSLAEHYAVSYTPVRAAVKQLVDEGWLLKGANRRLTPARPPEGGDSELSSAPFVPPNPPRDVRLIIEQDLVRLSLVGEPTLLREEAAAQRYGISRSAIRTIFHRLSGAGLLQHLPRRGWRVRPFSQADMHSFLEVRELLELKALELAQSRIDPLQIDRLLDANRFPEGDHDWPLIDNSLHAYFIELAANPYISDFFLRQGRYYEILFDWEDHDRDTAIETVRQHREILTAVRDQSWEAARQALAWHIRWNHPILSKITPRIGELDSNNGSVPGQPAAGKSRQQSRH